MEGGSPLLVTFAGSNPLSRAFSAVRSIAGAANRGIAAKQLPVTLPTTLDSSRGNNIVMLYYVISNCRTQAACVTWRWMGRFLQVRFLQGSCGSCWTTANPETNMSLCGHLGRNGASGYNPQG